MTITCCLVDGVEWDCILSGDLSSISGSESDSEDSDDSTPPSSSPFIYFTSGNSQTVYSMYRAAVTSGKVCVPSMLEAGYHPMSSSSCCVAGVY